MTFGETPSIDSRGMGSSSLEWVAPYGLVRPIRMDRAPEARLGCRAHGVFERR
jgi:hypothetical protein